ncbi:uncharacterized protein LOC124153419 isoform X2 [Ischnura elegans]|uniref:uncharacterized protein LOC124153419 isoform X2 n=1 Tax=Ischnura elegans TaxID=197161 RepID=UPI001ED8B5BE|nr:uncharacterized protein LOC124153419 isoform X2 [Ischnura elegans]
METAIPRPKTRIPVPRTCAGQRSLDKRNRKATVEKASLSPPQTPSTVPRSEYEEIKATYESRVAELEAKLQSGATPISDELRAFLNQMEERIVARVESEIKESKSCRIEKRWAKVQKRLR